MRTVKAYRFLLALGLVVWLPSSGRAVTDYVFTIVNGDSTATTAVQGDTIAWGANCAVGASMDWIVAIDLDGDSTLNVAADLIVGEWEGTDGDTLAESMEQDADGIANGWYLSAPVPLGIAPGYYLFHCTDLTDSTTAERGVTVTALPSPPNKVSGRISIPGHSAPDPLLENRWIEASYEGDTMSFWSGLTNDSGDYEINVGAIGSGLIHRVNVPDMPGYVSPDAQDVFVSGLVTGIDFSYAAPADSIYGLIKDPVFAPIVRDLRANAHQDGGDGNRRYETSDGSYVIYLAASETGRWWIGVDPEGLVPDYVVPFQLEYDYQGSSRAHDFVCYPTDAVIYVEVTVDGGPPASPLMVQAESRSLESWTEVLADSTAGSVFELHVSSLDPTGWDVWIQEWNDRYPLPAGYIVNPDRATGVAPGDTVHLNLTPGLAVSDMVSLDAGDPPVVWADVWVGLRNGGQDFGAEPDGSGFFTIFADTGSYWMDVYCDGYLSEPSSRNLVVTGDTTGGLGFTLNHAHARVWGQLLDVNLPLDAPAWIGARTDTSADGYVVGAEVDSATGTFEFYLCDGDWMIQPPHIDGYTSPNDTGITVAEAPDTVTHLDLTYTSVTVGVGDDASTRPELFSLHASYPNPFNLSARIRFTLAQASEVHLEIFDALGRSVTRLFEGSLPAGAHEFDWRGVDASQREVASGVYFYRLRAGEQTSTRKLLLLK